MALDWFVRLQESPDDEDLRAQLDAWLHSDPRRADAFSKLAVLWGMPELDVASQRLADRLDARRPAPVAAARRRPLFRDRYGRGLAALAAAFILAIGIQHYPALMMRWSADYLTAVGERTEVVLPDGSRMLLNTSSAIALDFDGPSRKVRLLEGEAYFDVKPDAARPFRVVGAFGEVEVTGTAFAVRTGAADTVILERGRVEVSQLSQEPRNVSLSPGEMVRVSASGMSAVEEVDPAMALAWRKGWIIFRDKPFGEVVIDLGRYYRGHIITVRDDIAKTRVSGNFRLSDPEGVVRSLAEAAGAAVTVLPTGVILIN